MVVVDVVMDQLDRVHERIAGRFTRSEPRARAREYESGLVAGLERKNGWTLAEQAGEISSDGMQRLLRWADWDIDGVRDDVRDYVVEHLSEPGGVLIVDDTGFLKKGVRSAGVQRQYSGTAGRIENCQIGTFLYLPEPWISDRERCRRAGIPDGTEFETKPRQAMAMLARAFAAKVPFAWITADEAYGQVKYLRAWLEECDAAYVLATKVNDLLSTTGGGEARADELVEQLPARSWRRLSVGAGAHGPREAPGFNGCKLRPVVQMKVQLRKAICRHNGINALLSQHLRIRFPGPAVQAVCRTGAEQTSGALFGRRWRCWGLLGGLEVSDCTSAISMRI